MISLIPKIRSKQEFQVNEAEIKLVKFQSAIRGHIARLALKELQDNKKEKSKAVVKIQSILRGYNARVQAVKAENHLLGHDLLEKAKHYIDTPSNLKDIPRATEGKTNVYLPKELPIVLKQSGFPKNQERFDQMEKARDICEKNGYKQLVIPKARIHGNFIVESKLPIIHGTKETIGFYIENREKFSDAVKEFTGFLCQSMYFADITGNCPRNPYAGLSKTLIGRYDNIALHLEKDQGKIGLIDLERWSPRQENLKKVEKLTKDKCYHHCCNAVHLFPLHLDEIMNAAREFDSNINIEVYRKDLERERDEALIRFKIAYEDHLEFIKQKGITCEKPLEVVELNSERKENIKKSIVLIIRNENDDDHYYKNCLGEEPDKVIKLFEESFLKILDLTTAFYSKMLNNKIKYTKKVTSYWELLSFRTLIFSYGSNKVYRDLIENVEKELQMMKLTEVWDKDSFSKFIIDSIFEELAKGREIAYYNNNFGVSHEKCIFW